MKQANVRELPYLYEVFIRDKDLQLNTNLTAVIKHYSPFRTEKVQKWLSEANLMSHERPVSIDRKRERMLCIQELVYEAESDAKALNAFLRLDFPGYPKDFTQPKTVPVLEENEIESIKAFVSQYSFPFIPFIPEKNLWSPLALSYFEEFRKHQQEFKELFNKILPGKKDNEIKRYLSDIENTKRLGYFGNNQVDKTVAKWKKELQKLVQERIKYVEGLMLLDWNPHTNAKGCMDLTNQIAFIDKFNIEQGTKHKTRLGMMYEMLTTEINAMLNRGKSHLRFCLFCGNLFSSKKRRDISVLYCQSEKCEQDYDNLRRRKGGKERAQMLKEICEDSSTFIATRVIFENFPNIVS